MKNECIQKLLFDNSILYLYIAIINILKSTHAENANLGNFRPKFISSMIIYVTNTKFIRAFEQDRITICSLNFLAVRSFNPPSDSRTKSIFHRHK